MYASQKRSILSSFDRFGLVVAGTLEHERFDPPAFVQLDRSKLKFSQTNPLNLEHLTADVQQPDRLPTIRARDIGSDVNHIQRFNLPR